MLLLLRRPKVRVLFYSTCDNVFVFFVNCLCYVAHMLASARMCCDDDDDPGGKNVANPDRMDRATMIFCSACVSVCNEYMHFFVLFVLLAFCALVLLSLS